MHIRVTALLPQLLLVVYCSVCIAENNPYDTFPAGDTGKRKPILDDLLARLPGEVKGDAFTKFLQRTRRTPAGFRSLPIELLSARSTRLDEGRKADCA